MMTKYHNSCRRRVAVALLAAVCIFGLWTSPILADPDEAACHCEIDFTGPPEICVDSTAHFTGIVTGVGMVCNVSTWTWDFGDPASGSANTGYGQYSEHVYHQPGIYTVTLTAVEAGGPLIVTKIDFIRVNPGPAADFTASTTVLCLETPVNFTDLSTNAASWQWDFGDGSTSGAQHPSHTYSAAGVYTVSLTVTNPCGVDTEIKSQYITVQGAPTADFVYTQRPGCTSGLVRFEDRSTGADVWYWGFGDGTESYDQNPGHTYAAGGTYTVTLTVSNDCGEDVKTKVLEVIVGAGPVADFTSDVTSLCEGGTVGFTDLSTDPTSWFWDFGDGSTSGAQHPNHTYLAAGVYTVRLTVSNPCGNDTEVKPQYITVRGGPTADFAGDYPSNCVGNAIDFTDLSTGALTWHWDFGDGITSDLQNPSHTYSASGSYTVSLRVTNACGDDAETKPGYVHILEGPLADFSSNTWRTCVGGLVRFQDESLRADSWHWNFGDGSTSDLQNPSHTYDAPGWYAVTLRVANRCGEDVEARQNYVWVMGDPVAEFVASSTSVCIGWSVAFLNHSQNSSSWDWDFGDGHTSTDSTGIHTYNRPGVYTVTLVASNGCASDTRRRELYIEVRDFPHAAFDAAPTASCVGEDVIFTDRSEHTTSWDWDFGDGSTSSQQNPSHAYGVAGTYTVTLTVHNDCGTDDVTRENYVIVERPPIAEFMSFDDWTCVGIPMLFHDMSTAATSWHWDFGDGGTSNDQNPYHVYQAAGVYTVTLRATNRCGEDTRVKTNYITVRAFPVADFTADATEVCAGATVSFSNLSSNETSWHWEFGDGSTSSVENPTHVYSMPGQYTVSLKVSNICGDDTESKAQYISVEVPPMADFDSNTRQVCEGGTVNFDDRSYRATSWHWEFGDGSTSDLQNPSHLYATAGLYVVTLHVSNRCGDDTEDRHNYIRVIVGPTAEFEASVTNVCVGWVTGFMNYSQNATSWRWNFGDGATSTDSVGHHVYATPGTYTVSLTAINACGDDTRTRTNYIVVRGYPVADFLVDDRESCVGATVTFTDLSRDADSWHWDFGDGGTSTDRSPTHAYSSPGVYTVTLSVHNDCGPDSEIKTQYVTVGYPPIAGFDTEIRRLCAGGSVSFFNMSTNGTSYLWHFGDGTTSTSMNPSHTYTTAGVYSVSLVATNACGSDTAMRENYITVDPLPVADFTAEPREGCAELFVSFTDLSTDATSWQWQFGDGTGSSSQNPDHTYAQPGSYTVTLTATNACGSDDAVKEAFIIVHGGPRAEFSFEYSSVGCTSQEVRFSDHSTGATTWNWDFGDGASSTDQHPTHTYTSGGTFLVTLTVNNACGEASTSREVVVVFGPPPVADFTAEATEVCEGEAVHFTNQSRNAYFWSWDFGDGQTSNDRDPSHAYSAAGSYTITLNVINECGSDSESKVNYVTVNAGPVADFSATPTSGQAPLIVAFTDHSTSTMGITSWSWDFGDGGTSNAQSPSHTYTAPGTYTVQLTVVDACGDDKAVKVEYVRVSSECEADFSAEPTEGCAPVRVFFNGFATEDCEISSWTWDFGDPASGNNNNATGQSAQHVYTTTGTYTVKLTAEDVSGTKVVTKTNFVTVWGGPTAVFSVTPTSGPAPLLVDFIDHSVAGRGALSWSWNFGDPASGSANTSTQQHPSHSYYDEGSYFVSLIVVDECGTDTVATTIVVSPAISITKAVDKAVAPAGDDLLYSVTIHNNGPSPVANIVVVDTIPDSSGFIVGSITGGGTYDANGDRVTWNLASLGSGAQVTLEFAVVLDGPFTQFPTIVSNQAFAAIGIEGTALSGRTFASNIVETVVDIPTGVLGLQKDVSATLAVPSDELTYTITVDNPNPAPAANVIIYDAIPDSTTYIAGSATAGGVYNPANDSLTWNLGVLAAFSSRSVSFRVTVDPNCVDGQLIPNTALVRSSLGGEESNRVITAISLTPIVVTKKVNRPSGMIGDLVKYTVTVENYSGVLFEDVLLSDTMPAGIFCVDGTSLLDGSSTNDPTGDQSLQWALGDLPARGILTLEYTALISTSAHPGINENVVRAEAYQGGVLTHSNRALAQIHVLSQTLAGAIRGRVMVDCDGDGVADFDSLPPGVVGTNVYLDDGSQSRVNEKGMFFFSTVRAGERVVALDERKLEGFYIPDGAQASVFVHVHETGESYVIFRICPDHPRLDIRKKASILPTVKVTKRAVLDPEQPADSMGVKVDYEIDIKSNGLADPTQIRVVDSLPANTHLILAQSQELAPIRKGDQLVYEVTAAQERFKKSVSYSLRELTPGVRKFLTNRVYLEGDLLPRGASKEPVVSEPVEVSAGPFPLVPPQDVVITLTPALFITSMADLQPPAIPQLHAAADSIMKYADADVKVEGHTDFRPIHTVRFPSNWELGEARAKSVVDWLVESRGIDPHRMTYESFAATKPVVTDVPRTSIALQPNRRTEVHIKTKVGGLLSPEVKAGDQWENSTSLALDPVKFDTLFEAVETPVDIDLGDSWEVLLTIENDGAMSADDVVLTDILPEGSEYLSNSAMVDGRSISAQISGQTISLDLKRIEPSQKLELRYRIRALEGRTPSGGGAASVEVKSATNRSVIQKSNEVRFK